MVVTSSLPCQPWECSECLAAILIVVYRNFRVGGRRTIQRHVVVLGGKVKMDVDEEAPGVGQG